MDQAKIFKIINNNPLAASILSKLNTDKTITSVSPINSNLQSIAMSVNEKIRSNEDIVQLFPDIELCIQILVSSILSPNDMINNKINYKAPDIKIPGSIKSTIVSEIESYIDKHYGINNKLPIILREALFVKGSYIEAIIPECSLDDIVSQFTSRNISMESGEYLNNFFKPTYEFLGSSNSTYNVSTEDVKDIYKIDTTRNDFKLTITQEDLNIEITDNYKVLNMSNVLIDSAKYRTKRKLYGSNLSLEDDETTINLNNFFKPGSSYIHKDYLEVNDANNSSRRSYGKPLVIKLPTESVIPVHVTNNPDKHLGYFVLIDNNGTPLTNECILSNSEVEHYDYMSINSDSKLSLIDKSKNAIFGMTKKDPTLNNLESMYSKIVENMLKDKLKTGDYGDLVDIQDNYEVYRVMFHRALKNQQTKILFLPSELVAFYAFEYRDNGTGKSLIEKTAILHSIRAILLFSRIMAYLKNSTTITEVTTNIDEKDPNPDSTMEQVKSEVLKQAQTAFPLGILATNDLTEWVTKRNTRMKFVHPGLPNTDINVSDMSTSKTIPDDELDRIIKDYVTMSFGLTPEIVEAGYNSDFATTVTAKNLLLAKRTTHMQNQFIPQVREHIRKILNNDFTIRDIISKIVEDNLKDIKKYLKGERDENSNAKLDNISKVRLVDYVVDRFINELEISLPKPEIQDANNIKAAYEDYQSTMESVLDTLFSTEAIPTEYAGELSNHIEPLKAMFKTVLLKEWISENNFLPEIQQFLTKDENGKPTFNILENYADYLDSIIEAFIPFIKKRVRSINETDDKINKATEGLSDSLDNDIVDNNNNDDEIETI